MLINLADLSGYNVKNTGKWSVEMLNVTGRTGQTEAGRSLKLIGFFNQKTYWIWLDSKLLPFVSMEENWNSINMLAHA